MARSRYPESDAAAVRLLAMLTEYEGDVGGLVLHWGDRHDWSLYTRVAGAIEGVRNVCGAHPGLSVPCLQLLISHAELMDTLCSSPRKTESAALAERYAGHLRCIRRVQDTCRKLLARTR